MGKTIGKVFAFIAAPFVAVFTGRSLSDSYDFVLNGFQDPGRMPNLREDPSNTAQGVTVSKTGTNNPIPVIYGHRMVGGNLIYADTNGDTNKYLYTIFTIAEGPIAGVIRVFIDDQELPNVWANKTLPPERITPYPHTTIVNIDREKFSGRVRFQIFNGFENQPQSSLANQAPQWATKKRTLPGVAYAVFRFEYKKINSNADAENNPFAGGIPSVKFEILGKTIYDVRRHNVAVNGKTISGSTPNYSDLFKEYGINPANCLLDYLMNPRYGCGIPREKIDAESFKIAADKFEQQIQYSNSQSGRALTCNAAIDTAKSLFENTKTLVGACRGIMPYTQGRYKLKVEDGGHPTDITSATITSAYDITLDNIIGPVQLNGERKSTKYNQVIVNYIDPDREFTNQQVIYTESADVTSDDEPLIGEFTFHTITNPAIARDIARMIYKKSRLQKQLTFKATQELIDVEVGDIIRITEPVLKLNLDTYRVVSMKLNEDSSIDIDAVEHDPLIYPSVPGPVIEVPAPTYEPNTYNLEPLLRPKPQQPVSIAPIIDPDYDSAGDPISVDPNTPPKPDINDLPKIIQPEQPIQPPVKKYITKFEDFSKQYNGYYYLNGNINNPNEALDPLLDTPLTSSVVYFAPDTRWRQTYNWNFGLFGIVGNRQMQVVLNTPSDPGIDQLVLRVFRNNKIIDERVKKIRNAWTWNIPYSYSPYAITRTCPFTGLYHPIDFNFAMSEYQLNDYIQVRWRNDDLDLEYEDGSVFPGTQSPNKEDSAGSEWFSHIYQLQNGNVIEGTNLEALINYANNFSITGAGPNYNTSLQTNISLGS